MRLSVGLPFSCFYVIFDQSIPLLLAFMVFGLFSFYSNKPRVWPGRKSPSDLCCVKWDAKPELTQSINQSLLLLYKSFPLKKPFFPQDHLGLGPDPLGSRFFLTRAICRYASTICCVRQCVRLSARVPVRSREFYESRKPGHAAGLAR